jgi:hypothetical protein
MKNNKGITALTTLAQSVTFPRDDQNFNTFKSRLRGLVSLNFGYVAERTFDYDEYSQTFYWKSDESTIVSLNGTRISISRNFSLDPRKPIEEEFARIYKEYGALTQARQDASKALRAIGAEVD